MQMWNRHNAQKDANLWGAIPTLSLVMACGLMLISIADTAARMGLRVAEPLFWISLVVIFVPTSVRVVSAQASRRERLGLLLALGVAIYMVKVLNSPLYFTFADELHHLRTLENILATQHLFSSNPMLPIGPEYPGLQAAILPYLTFSGLSNYSAGIVLIGMARLVLILGLFLFYEQVGKSDRVAGIASVLYMTNPHYVFFDAQFSYESLALPLSILVMFAAVRSLRQTNGAHRILTITILLGIAAVVTTHHVTNQMLIIFLGVWTAAFFFCRSKREDEFSPSWATVLAILITVMWISDVAQLTTSYLAPRLADAWSDLTGIILHRASPRQLFTDDVGQRTPFWERSFGYLSVGLIMLGMPSSLLDVWKNYRSKAIALVLAAGAVMYPLTQALRFTENGLEMAGRFLPFVFVALCFILALGSQRLLNSQWVTIKFHNWGRIILVSLVLGVQFIGAVVVSFPRWARMPGPYLVGADMRSVEPEGINAAQWMLKHNGPDNRIATDRTNALLQNAFGMQRVVTAAYDNAFMPTAFLSPDVNNDVLDELQRGKVRYLLVDFRLSWSLPLVGYYYDGAETRSFPRTGPVSLTTLHKYDNQVHAQRIYDSGHIAIYDISLITSNDLP